MVRALGRAFEQRNPYGFVVESRAGANTIIAANACKAAPPDGYTLCLLSRSTVSINPCALQESVLRPGQGFRADHQSRFRPSGPDPQQQRAGQATWQGAGRLFQAEPGEAQFRLVRRSAAIPHLIVEWMKHEHRREDHPHSLQGRLRRDAGVQRGRHPAALSHHRQSRYRRGRSTKARSRACWCPASTRNPIIPNVPTFAESACRPTRPGIETWFGMFAPKGHAGGHRQQAQRRIHRDREDVRISPSKYLTSKGLRAGRRQQRGVREVHRGGSEEGQAPRGHFRRQAGAMTADHREPRE